MSPDGTSTLHSIYKAGQSIRGVEGYIKYGFFQNTKLIYSSQNLYLQMITPFLREGEGGLGSSSIDCPSYTTHITLMHKT